MSSVEDVDVVSGGPTLAHAVEHEDVHAGGDADEDMPEADVEVVHGLAHQEAEADVEVVDGLAHQEADADIIVDLEDDDADVVIVDGDELPQYPYRSALAGQAATEATGNGAAAAGKEDRLPSPTAGENGVAAEHARSSSSSPPHSPQQDGERASAHSSPAQAGGMQSGEALSLHSAAEGPHAAAVEPARAADEDESPHPEDESPHPAHADPEQEAEERADVAAAASGAAGAAAAESSPAPSSSADSSDDEEDSVLLASRAQNGHARGAGGKKKRRLLLPAVRRGQRCGHCHTCLNPQACHLITAPSYKPSFLGSRGAAMRMQE